MAKDWESRRNIDSLLKDAVNHYDNDIRFMAIRDLTKILDGMASIPTQVQDKVGASMKIMLKDKATDVQTTAVRMLGVVVRKLEPERVRDVVSSLVRSLVRDDEKNKNIQKLQREQFQTAIKKSVRELRAEDGKAAGGQMVEQLSGALTNSDTDLQLICMDLLCDIVSRFGAVVSVHHRKLVERLQAKLPMNSNEEVPIRAGKTLGAVAKFLDQKEFDSLANFLLTKISTTSDDAKVVPYIRTIGIVSREVGSRMGSIVEKLLPLLQSYCKLDAEVEGGEMSTKIELWQSCFVAFEFIVVGCPDIIQASVPELVKIFMKGMSFDPNLALQTDDMNVETVEDDWGDEEANGKEEDDWGAEEGGEMDDGWGEGAGATDESDDSWKIRLQAALCLTAFIVHEKDMLQNKFPGTSKTFQDEIKEFLVKRLSEREETVTITNIAALKAFAETTNAAGNDVISKALKQFDGAAGTVKTALLELLQLCVAKVGRSSSFPCKPCLDPILDGVTSSNEELQIRALECLDTFASIVMSPTEFKDHISKFVAHVGESSSASKDRIKIPALRASGSLAYCVNNKDEKSAFSLFHSVLKALKLKDVDDDVKHAALEAIGKVIIQLKDALDGKQNDVIEVLIDRLKGSSTRLSALKTLGALAKDRAIEMKEQSETLIETLTTLLEEKFSNNENYESARALIAITQGFKSADNATQKHVMTLLEHAPWYISDTDKYLSGLMLDLVSAILNCPVASEIKESAFKETIKHMIIFAQSPLVDSQSLDSLVTCFKNISVKISSFANLNGELTKLVDSKMMPHSVSVIAKCIAGMAASASASTRTQFINKALGDLKTSKAIHTQQLALLSIGGVGRTMDLSSNKGIDAMILRSFDSPHAVVKSSASYALGNLAGGRLDVYLPGLLKDLGNRHRHSYLLLQALREVIICHYDAKKALAPFASKILSTLKIHTDSKETAVRIEVAECLGCLSKVEPKDTFKFIAASLKSTSSSTRAVAVGAVRFALTAETVGTIASQLAEILQMFKDDDLEVRRQVTLSFMALLKGTELLDSGDGLKFTISTVIPTLYRETVPNEKYIRVIEVGPLKIREDDHLPLRQAAFDALASILETRSDRLDMNEFFSYTMQGMLDYDEDIILRTWDMYYNLVKDSKSRPILNKLSKGKSKNGRPMYKILLDFIKKKMSTLKKTTTTRETDVARECVKKALITCFLMAETPGADEDFAGLVVRIKKTKALANEVKAATVIVSSGKL
mmetsp:Transcript_7969/g.12038  ORF Transcript_7969/g.12038 Transcript_7969/m.12038 type:complete len:1248 (-) Transcript_7969:181-3924(-)